jgi:hypothetical protein
LREARDLERRIETDLEVQRAKTIREPEHHQQEDIPLPIEHNVFEDFWDSVDNSNIITGHLAPTFRPLPPEVQGSYLLIPPNHNSKRTPSKTEEELLIENEQLRRTLDIMSRDMERLSQENALLKKLAQDHVYQ